MALPICGVWIFSWRRDSHLLIEFALQGFKWNRQSHLNQYEGVQITRRNKTSNNTNSTIQNIPVIFNELIYSRINQIVLLVSIWITPGMRLKSRCRVASCGPFTTCFSKSRFFILTDLRCIYRMTWNFTIAPNYLEFRSSLDFISSAILQFLQTTGDHYGD